eukprot:scaffold271_cov336-Pavlova_lutheri.AAC.56
MKQLTVVKWCYGFFIYAEIFHETYKLDTFTTGCFSDRGIMSSSAWGIPSYKHFRLLEEA